MGWLPANLKVKLGHISINVKHFKAARCSNKSCSEWSRKGGGEECRISVASNRKSMSVHHPPHHLRPWLHCAGMQRG